MKPLCVAAVVNRPYQEYVPLYLYFLFFAYPEYEAIIYFDESDGPLHPEVQGCLDLIRGMGAFQIKPLEYAYERSNPRNLAAMRWVIDDADFAGYENVYTGDIDLLIVRERPGLCEVHVAHSEEIQLPYSNRVRGGTRRLTGLHFVRTQAYYPNVRSTMDRYRRQIANGSLRLNDEELLYAMMEESVGLPAKRGNFVVHHGMHLRAFDRDASPIAQQRTRTDYLFAKVFERYDRAFMECARTQGCAEILDRLSRISYPRGVAERSASCGPAALRQFETVVRLCRELKAEREADRA
jgi:hypothetical protein